MDLIEFAVWLITEQPLMAWLAFACLGLGTLFSMALHGTPKGLLVYRDGNETRYPEVINMNTFPKSEVRRREPFDFENFNKWIKENPERAFYWTAIILAILVLFFVIWTLAGALA